MSAKEQGEGPHWDLLVRLTHWTVALAVVLNGLVVEGGSLLHVWIGYTALALLLLRLVWGFVGTEEARFSSFPPSLGGALEHLRGMFEGRRELHRSHNPLGALMVYALWATLAVTALTGLAMDNSAPVPRSELAAAAQLRHAEEEDEDDEGGGESSEILEELHETAANLLLILAALHVAGVAIESRRLGRNLVRPMITGGGRGGAA